jgi:RsmE family RNA methyltransferase
VVDFDSLILNLILFHEPKADVHLPADDRRARHLSQVLRPTPGQSIDVGCLNGPRGKAVVRPGIEPGSWDLTVRWGGEVLSLEPIDWFVGLPRPQTARKILNTGSTLGVQRILFFGAEKGEAAYRQSKLWSSGEWRRHLEEGAEQAFHTCIPEVLHFQDLQSALEQFKQPGYLRLGLDIYEAERTICQCPPWSEGVQLAFGPERGFGGSEREILRENGFSLVSLGGRVLRTETACAYALGAIQQIRR